MEEALKDGEYAVVSDLDAAKVLQPSVGALDFPSSSIASQLAFVLEAAVANVAAIRSNQFCPALHHSPAERIGIIAPIGNHAAQPGARTSAARAWHSHRVERAFRKPVFGNLRGRELRSDRYAAAVDHHHALRTFPATGFADCGAPFFAVTKVASKNASSQSNNPRSSICPSNLCQTRSHTPCSSHIRKRRQQVDPFGYSTGMSRHLAPVRRIHSMPSKHDRFDAQGRPRPSFRRFGSGNIRAKIAHCASLKNTGRFFIQEAHQHNRLNCKSLS
jgi:hypothetical protein